jgi:molybdopterin-containing oxidoreductase family iron-sulfur binding subunit
MSSLTPGNSYWRSLEQLAETPEVRDELAREFSNYDPETITTTSRRSFLKLMAASLAMAGIGLSGCRRVPVEKLAPYTANPRDRIPGVPERFATQFELNGVATGLLVTCYDGRPIKIEGNPSHPFSWTVKGKVGAADALAQATILELYDPARNAKIAQLQDQERVQSTWDAFSAFAGPHFTALRADSSPLAVIAEPANGPTALDMKKRFLDTFPKATWCEYDPLSRDVELDASRMIFGKALRPVLHLEQAKVAVLLDADLLGSHPAKVRYGADWAATRRSADVDRTMSRVYLAETGFSITGTVADERLPISPDRVEPIARALAAKLELPGTSDANPVLSEAEKKFVAQAAADLKSAGKNGVVAAGPGAAVEAHALALLINRALGAIGTTITLHAEPDGDRTSHFQAITDLAAAISGNKITTLLILGGNPAYDTPAELDFATLLPKVSTTIRLGVHDDETSRLCTWHLPKAHYLEAWNDARALDGTPGVCQPLIEPLFGGRSNLEVLALLSGDELTSGEELVKRTWQQLLGEENFEKRFRLILEAGVWPEGAESPANPRLKRATVPPSAVSALTGGTSPVKQATPVLRFTADSRTHDGRFANNAWLQETPDPLTKLVWENALVMNQQDAAAAGLALGDWAVLTANSRVVSVPVFILPGQPAGVMSLSLGYGRSAAGPVGDGLGANAYAIRTAAAPYFTNVTLSKGSGSHTLASTQNHHAMDAIGRHGQEEKVGERGKSGEIIREAELAEYKKDSNFAKRIDAHTVRLQLFEPPGKCNTPHAWGMTVDLNACIGCNACTVACQSENNIPVVGREQVLMHRQMNWIRVDRYFKGDTEANPADVDVVFQPVMCQHCENAPCEQVCPATATVHDTEGLNTMVYNRCIGTRYCSNNCAYKVRRFNYFDFHSKDPRAATATAYVGIPDQQQREQIDPVTRMAFNPEVTVRMRGVMEKCTYCVQRIHSATVAAKAKGQNTVNDGDIMTACQQSCPTQAIKFGNLNDPHAEVTQQQKNPRAYELLGELNNRPRTKYLAKLRNPATPSAGTPGEGRGGRSS